MATRKRHGIDTTGIAVLTDIPVGKGSQDWSEWDPKLQTRTKAYGSIAYATLMGDRTLIELVRPSGDIPDEYQLEALKLCEDGINIYEKPSDEVKKKVYNEWMAYGKLMAKMERANSHIYTAIWTLLALDLKENVESKKDLTKGDGRQLYMYLMTRFSGGGASSLRIKMNEFERIKFDDGNI